MNMNILVAMRTEPRHQAQIIDAAGASCEVVFAPRPTDEQIGCADIVIGNISPDRLESSGRLKLVQLQSAGVGNQIALCAPGRNVRLCTAAGSYGLAISEHMFGILLGLQKRLFSYRDQQSSGAWNDLGGVRSVSGAQVLVVGMGGIGSAFAQRCCAFGAHVRGIRRTPSQCPDYCEAVSTPEMLDKWLPEADVVFLCMPETELSVGIMNRERLYSMKRGAILLNAGRGTAIDTMALVDALNDGVLSGVGLDVTDPEPLPAAHPLWACTNAMITPHVSGGLHLQQTHDNIVSIACKNIRAFIAGECLTNEVDYERGY